jgi:nucleotide-binding universal stress UspA family protein
MGLRKLLVPMVGTADEVPALSTALAVAKTVGAHVEALFMAIDPELEIVSGDYISPAVINQITKETAKENEKRRRRTRALFGRLTHKYGVPTDLSPTKNGLSAAYVEVTGSAHSLMAHHGRLCDLIVIEPGAEHGSEMALGIEAALRDSGRPVLVTRRPEPAGFAKCIGVAWNGSLEATRTIGFAMTLLERAEKVVILTVEDDGRYGPPAMELKEYLAWHGISAVAISLPPPPPPHGQGDALIVAAKEHGIDLMMLGAYTRGELRRLIFGGVTGTMLAESPVPLLMMH